MALFRSHVLKQRCLVPRFSSSVVYYVHSHLQYTASPTFPQAEQKFVFPKRELSRQHNQNLTTVQQSDIKYSDNFHHIIQGNDISITGSQPISNIVILKSLDPLINQKQLALLSLNYDEKWFKSLKTTSRLLENKHTKFSLMADQDDYYKNQKDIVCWTVHKYGEASKLQETASLNAIMHSNNFKDLYKQTDAKNSVKDKCDPLHLAMVFQSLRDEIPLFFSKGHGYELYHRNMTFVNGLLGTTFRGLRAYKIIMTAMRIACQLSMTYVTMEILKITKNSKDCNITVRWRVSGVPRFAILRPCRAKHEVDDNSKRYVDGFSIFEIGEDGLIHCHRLLKLIPSQPRQLDDPLWALNTAAVLTLLQQEKSFQMLARHRVENIEDTISLSGAI